MAGVVGRAVNATIDVAELAQVNKLGVKELALIHYNVLFQEAKAVELRLSHIALAHNILRHPVLIVRRRGEELSQEHHDGLGA